MDVYNATSRSRELTSSDADPSDSKASGLQELQHSRNTFAWTKQTDGRWTWWIREDWLPLWSAADAPEWKQIDGDPRAECVKLNDGRAVFRTRCQGRLVFVKCARPPRRWPRLQRWLMGSAARREHRAGRYAEEHGIPAVEIVAHGEAPLRGRAYSSLLVTTGLADAIPLDELWLSLDKCNTLIRSRRNAVIDEVARLIAHAHQNGFHHLDLHAGNVLMQSHEEGRIKAVFVDLQNVRVGRTVTRRAVLRNLAQLNQWFSIHASLADRWRFLRRYLHWRGWYERASSFSRVMNLDERALLPLLAEAVDRHSNRLYAKRDRIAMRTGRYYAHIELDDGWRAHVYLSAKHAVAGSPVSRLDLSTDLWKSLLADPASWLSPLDRRQTLKSSGTSKVCRASLQTTAGTEVAVVCKRKTPKSWWKRLLYPFRMSCPMRTWKTANALLNRRIPTARPLAAMERRVFGLLRDDLLITEYIENARDLDAVLTVTLRALTPGAQRRLKSQLIDAIISVVRTLTTRGFVHRDFKALNLLVQWRPEWAEPPRIVLVDLDGVRRARRSETMRAALRMMTRLNVSLDHCRRVSRTDRLRFLLRYLQLVQRSDCEWKVLWRRLESDSRKKRAHRQKRQRSKLEKHGRI